jgi:hypothetical protein
MAAITDGLNMSYKSVYIWILWEYRQVYSFKRLVQSCDKDAVMSDSNLRQKENW